MTSGGDSFNDFLENWSPSSTALCNVTLIGKDTELTCKRCKSIQTETTTNALIWKRLLNLKLSSKYRVLGRLSRRRVIGIQVAVIMQPRDCVLRAAARLFRCQALNTFRRSEDMTRKLGWQLCWWIVSLQPFISYLCNDFELWANTSLQRNMISTIRKKLNLQCLPYMPQNLVNFGPETA